MNVKAVVLDEAEQTLSEYAVSCWLHRWLIVWPEFWIRGGGLVLSPSPSLSGEGHGSDRKSNTRRIGQG